MRTAIIIVAGLVLMAACLFAGRLLGKPAAESVALGVMLFIPLWFAAAAINMWIGVAQAGYGFMEELPIFLVIFGLPAGAALLAWRNWS